MNETPRLRMFAGANGSGKSTLKSVINPALLGVYINPDDIEREIRTQGFLDFSAYQVRTNADEVLSFFTNSSFLKSVGLLDDSIKLTFDDNKLSFANIEVNSYFASVASDFIRHKLLENSISFTFETVMSSSDKVEFLQKAQQCGFRTYLYYITTEDPIINISRVQYRVEMGGHSVPENKIIERHQRSLDLLFDAVQYSNRAYIFDNSGDVHVWLAEITDGEELEMKTDFMTNWFKTALWDKF
jgi:predicted ABC-type ATPase